jgi:RES domain-containing protein
MRRSTATRLLGLGVDRQVHHIHHVEQPGQWRQPPSRATAAAAKPAIWCFIKLCAGVILPDSDASLFLV